MLLKGFSLGVISWGPPLSLCLGNPLQFWLRNLSDILSIGAFSCYSLELLSNCSGKLAVPLELQQVSWGFFRTVGEPPL